MNLIGYHYKITVSVIININVLRRKIVAATKLQQTLQRSFQSSKIMSKRQYAREVIFDYRRLVSSPERSKDTYTTFKASVTNDVKARRNLVIILARCHPKIPKPKIPKPKIPNVQNTQGQNTQNPKIPKIEIAIPIKYLTAS